MTIELSKEAAAQNDKTSLEVITACQEGLEDVRAGRVYTLDEMEEHVQDALAARRREKEQRRQKEQLERAATW